MKTFPVGIDPEDDSGKEKGAVMVPSLLIEHHGNLNFAGSSAVDQPRTANASNASGLHVSGFRREIAVLGVLGVLLLACTVEAVPPSMVPFVESVETGGRNVPGKNFERGVTQLKLAAWKDASRYRLKKGLRTYPYAQAWTPSINRQYCQSFLEVQESRLTRHLKRTPTKEELYGAYRWGFEGFKRRGAK